MDSDYFSTIIIIFSLVFSFVGWIIYLKGIYCKHVDSSTWGWIATALTYAGAAIVQFKTNQMLVGIVYITTVGMALVAAFYSSGWKTKTLKDWLKILPSVGFVLMSLWNPLYAIVLISINIVWVNSLFIYDIRIGRAKEQALVWALWLISTLFAVMAGLQQFYQGATWQGMVLPVWSAFWLSLIMMQVIYANKKQLVFEVCKPNDR